MTQRSHQTAPTQFVEAAGVRFAYRRFGTSGGVPLVLNMHFTGTMDHWDPLVTDGLAATREVIPFNNAGISSTSGEVPASVEEVAVNAAAFIGALGLPPKPGRSARVHAAPRAAKLSISQRIASSLTEPWPTGPQHCRCLTRFR